MVLFFLFPLSRPGFLLLDLESKLLVLVKSSRSLWLHRDIRFATDRSSRRPEQEVGVIDTLVT